VTGPNFWSGPGRVCKLWVWRISLKNTKIFNFFYSVKKISSGLVKNMQVKNSLAPYFLWVKSMLRSGQGPSFRQINLLRPRLLFSVKQSQRKMGLFINYSSPYKSQKRSPDDNFPFEWIVKWFRSALREKITATIWANYNFFSVRILNNRKCRN